MVKKYYNIDDLRKAAKKQLPKGLFEFIDRGVEDEIALKESVSAFRDIKLLPRPMIDVSKRQAAANLFGRPAAMPLVVAPTGAAGLCWYEGELALAKAAAKFGIPFTLATASMTDMKRVSAVLPEGGFWFQLYMYAEKELSFELVRRAQQAGAAALLVTVDQTALPNREYMYRNGFGVPFKLTPAALAEIATHPRWLFGVLSRYLATSGMPKNRNYPTGYQRSILSDPKKNVGMANDTITWDDIKRIRSVWPGKLLVKGILRPEDAVRCVGIGVDGVVVSTHGGRTFDSAIPSILALPGIANAVKGKCTILLDSGIRRGSDIFKAVAFGADGVLTGRATLYGVAADGAAGAERALEILNQEFLNTMAHAGCNAVSDISADLIHASTITNTI